MKISEPSEPKVPVVGGKTIKHKKKKNISRKKKTKRKSKGKDKGKI
jgi:hypothetical protein